MHVGIVFFVAFVLSLICLTVQWVRERTRPAPTYVPVAEARTEVLEAAAGGAERDRIRAVKILRDRTGLGLSSAYQTVQRWLAEENVDWR